MLTRYVQGYHLFWLVFQSLWLGFGQEYVFSRSLPNSVGASRLWDSCLLNSIGSHSHHQIASDRSLTSRIILEALSCNCHPTCTSFKALEYYLFVQCLNSKTKMIKSLNSVYDKPLDMNNTGDWSRSKCPSCRVGCLWSKELCWWYVKSFKWISSGMLCSTDHLLPFLV
jgi:hypothetical protein